MSDLPQDRIIFLDIDGPMIPSYVFVKNIDCSMSSKAREFSTYCVAAINEVCKQTGAVIVFNTTHNIHSTEVGTIREDAIANGILPEYIHTNAFTKYPTMNSRLKAIKQWLSEYGTPDTDWLAVDDADISEAEYRWIEINFNNGVDVTAMNTMLRYWGGRPFFVL